ncbi:MAG: hypothetical protein Q7T49_02965 [bacterium]|nr:hypothetical protein [bacterium]
MPDSEKMSDRPKEMWEWVDKLISAKKPATPVKFEIIYPTGYDLGFKGDISPLEAYEAATAEGYQSLEMWMVQQVLHAGCSCFDKNNHNRPRIEREILAPQDESFIFFIKEEGILVSFDFYGPKYASKKHWIATDRVWCWNRFCFVKSVS